MVNHLPYNLVVSLWLIQVFVPSIKPKNYSKDYSVCGHARNQMYISAEGRALPCMSLSGQDIQNKFL